MSAIKRRLEDIYEREQSIVLGAEERMFLVETLESVKHEHYEDGHEGLAQCDSLLWVTPKLPCDCGADEINARIDEAIAIIRGVNDGNEAQGEKARAAENERGKEVCEREGLYD